MTPFAAVLLAGGQSRRMGRDKATLLLPDGQRLWERQLGILRELAPAELFISGPRREGFPADVPLLADEFPGRGPLGGITAALTAMTSPLLLVLAIDLPKMTTAFLWQLIRASRAGCGVVPRIDESTRCFYEPLAAVYPLECLTRARDRLAGADYSLQGFVLESVAADQVQDWILRNPDERELFSNWNTPEDAG